MGLRDWATGVVLGRAIKPALGPILKGIEWLNAYPGRKKGIGAVLLGFGTSLRVFGLDADAQAIEGFNSVIQGLSTTSDIVGVLMTVWGFIHPLIASHQTLQKQATNVLVKVQEKTPDASVEVKQLQATAIEASREAVAVVKVEEGKQ